MADKVAFVPTFSVFVLVVHEIAQDPHNCILGILQPYTMTILLLRHALSVSQALAIGVYVLKRSSLLLSPDSDKPVQLSGTALETTVISCRCYRNGAGDLQGKLCS